MHELYRSSCQRAHQITRASDVHPPAEFLLYLRALHIGVGGGVYEDARLVTLEGGGDGRGQGDIQLGAVGEENLDSQAG